jgi:hypothetical protein
MAAAGVAVIAAAVVAATGTGSAVTGEAKSSGARDAPARVEPARTAPHGAVSAAALDHGRWSVLKSSPLGARDQPTFVTAGSDLVEIGGSPQGHCLEGSATQRQGAIYNPTARKWRRIAAAPANILAGCPAAAVWTGKQVFIFGGVGGNSGPVTHVAGLYDPSTNRWTTSSNVNIGPLCGASAVWFQDRVMLAGTGCTDESKLQVASYDPADNRWTRLHPPISSKHPTEQIAIVSTDDGMLMWSLWGRVVKVNKDTTRESAGVDVLRLGSTGAWSNVTGRWPLATTISDPVFTGSKVLLAPGQIWCGNCIPAIVDDAHGYLVNPKTLARRSVPLGPLDAVSPQVLWSGAAEISLNASGEIEGPHVKVLPGDIAIWNPITRKWNRGPRAPAALSETPAVWNGARMFVLGHEGQLLAYGR